MSEPTFADVQKILFTIANAADENVRFGIYGRHDTKGRYSWESEAEFVASIASFPSEGGDVRLFSPVNFKVLSDADILKNCRFLQVISPAGNGRMPKRPQGSGRRAANADELATIMAWIRTLDLSTT